MISSKFNYFIHLQYFDFIYSYCFASTKLNSGGYGGGDFYDDYEEDDDYSWSDSGPYGNGNARFRGRGRGSMLKVKKTQIFMTSFCYLFNMKYHFSNIFSY